MNKTAKALAAENGLLKEYTIWGNIVGRCNRGYAKLHKDFYTFDSWLGWAKEQKVIRNTGTLPLLPYLHVAR